MAYRLRSPEEIQALGHAGDVLWRVLCRAREAAAPGVTTRQIEALIRECCEAEGLSPSMPEVCHPQTGERFPGVCSISINDEAAHAPPGERVLAANDLVTIDLAASLDGWHADAAVTTLCLGSRDLLDPAKSRLAQAAIEVTRAAVESMTPGGPWSDAVCAAREAADRLGVFILPGLGGHGIGRALHESPAARFDAAPESGQNSGHNFRLVPGTVLTVEPVVTLTRDEMDEGDPDGWTLRTRSGGPAASEERMVAMSPGGARVLTGADAW
ncbi:MAG: methionyl aminopeptidase [Phycisphaerales bacterium]